MGGVHVKRGVEFPVVVHMSMSPCLCAHVREEKTGVWSCLCVVSDMRVSRSRHESSVTSSCTCMTGLPCGFRRVQRGFRWLPCTVRVRFGT